MADDFFCTVRPSQLHLRGELRQGGLHPVVDVDRVDVGIAAEHEADGQAVAAVIAARRFHVDHLVDADDLRLDRLRDAGFDDGGRGAGIGRGHLHLRRHDVGQLRDRDAQHRQRAGDRDDDRDDDRQPRPIDEDRRDHGLVPAPRPWLGRRRRGAASPAVSAGGGVAGRGRDRLARADPLQPLADDQSRLPSSPLMMTAVDGVDWPSWMRRTSRLVLRIDDIDIVALLVGQHRGARDREHRDRLHAFEHHGDEFAVGQLARTPAPGLGMPGSTRVRDDAAQGERVGVFGDRRRHIVELACPVRRCGRPAAAA